MSPENPQDSSESDVTSMNFDDTELTLGLPGEGRYLPAVNGGNGNCMKRGFFEPVDVDFGKSVTNPIGKSQGRVNDISGAGKPPAAKAQVVGWPPVRSFRKKALESCKYVKVAVDGAPFLRKVDLKSYSSYQDLLRNLQEMFTCFTIRRNTLEENVLMDLVNGIEYVPTYEDKDGDWMLVGDVPWKMFIDSCKRIHLMKSSEGIGLAPRTPTKCMSTS